MTRFDIPWEDNYIGVWIGDPLKELRIRKIGSRRYLATLLIDGQPINRPWMNNAPTIDMPAAYTFSAMDGSDFSVDLWTDERFAINLNYEPDYQIYDDPPCEALTMGITRQSELDLLDEYDHLLGGLEHFVRSQRDEARASNAIGIGPALLRDPPTPPSMRIRTRRFVSWEQARSNVSID